MPLWAERLPVMNDITSIRNVDTLHSILKNYEQMLLMAAEQNRKNIILRDTRAEVRALKKQINKERALVTMVAKKLKKKDVWEIDAKYLTSVCQRLSSPYTKIIKITGE
jgi:hypothetical protein